jgi:conjugative transfer signal peptidase TraF
MFGLALVVCVSLVTVHLMQPRPRLIWNASASVPIGLYWRAEIRDLKQGDLVLAWLPDLTRTQAAKRAYLPLNTPAIKRVAALPGDVVCVRNGIVIINERVVAMTMSADHAGRPLTAWRGCGELEPDQVFLLNDATQASFDGRYFGPTSRRDIIGRLVPLWVF